jgi:hypothetical protein
VCLSTMAWRHVENMEVKLHPVQTLTLDQGKQLTFHSDLLTPKGESPWFTYDRRLGGPQNWSGCASLLGMKPHSSVVSHFTNINMMPLKLLLNCLHSFLQSLWRQ